jgi:hypothetical protein
MCYTLRLKNKLEHFSTSLPNFSLVMGDLKSWFAEPGIPLYTYICTHAFIYYSISTLIPYATYLNLVPINCQQISLLSQKLSHKWQCDSPHSSCTEHFKIHVFLVLYIWLSKSEDDVTQIFDFFHHLILDEQPTMLPLSGKIQKYMKHTLLGSPDGAVLCPHRIAPTE